MPEQEARRLARLRAAHILDTAPEPVFDSLTRAAARLLKAPIALVSLVDAERQWFKSRVGLPEVRETPRLGSFCTHALLLDEPLVVPDARLDARFRNSPLVAGEPHIRFYAGAPIRLSDGTVPGTLCVIDRQPRLIGADELAVLSELSAAAAHAIELRDAALGADAMRQALELERERLGNILAGTRAGTWEWQVQTGEARFNERWAEMLGYRLEELWPFSVSTWADRVHPDDLPAARRRLQVHFDGQDTSCDVEFRMRHREGHWLWVNGRGKVSSRTADGRPGWMFGVILDITARKTAELALQRASASLELANRVARIGSWELDPLRCTVRWSELTCELHEVPADFQPDLETAIRFYREGVHRERITQVVRRALERGEPFDIELQIVTGRGNIRWVRAVGVAETMEGRVTRLYGSFHDIDERVRAEEQRVARLQAEQASSAKSAFIARMSHELRTPLNAMLGFAELLLARGDSLDAEARATQLQHARAAGQHLLALVNDLLDLSRVESGALRVQTEALDLAELARLSAAELRPRALQLGVVLDLRLPDMASVLGDATRMRQVLHNLLNNALQYNRPGGRVTLRIELDADRVHLAVRDTGLGMDAAQLSHLFEPFNRLGREASPAEGTGIGLVITRHLLQLMGANLEVSSEAGVGSEFRFSLRRAPMRTPAPLDALQGPTAAARADALAVRHGVAGRVLYIDDDPINRILMEATVELRPQVQLICAESGRQGVEVAAQQPFDLVLVDMMLPDMTGHDVLEAVRQTHARETLPCVVVSANALPRQIADSLQAGFDDYITKPVQLHRLLAVLDEVLGRRAGATTATLEGG